MNEKREVILPSDFSGEKGKIVCYRISSYLELLYIDIRSRRIPEVQIQAYEGEAVMTVNFSFLGKCEVLLKKWWRYLCGYRGIFNRLWDCFKRSG